MIALGLAQGQPAQWPAARRGGLQRMRKERNVRTGLTGTEMALIDAPDKGKRLGLHPSSRTQLNCRDSCGGPAAGLAPGCSPVMKGVDIIVRLELIG